MGATVLAQMPASDQSAPSTATQSASASSTDPNDSTTYATGKPLGPQSKEGFWGHMNPFARKNWVQREVDPIRDRTNELDQLQAKNANDIKDVDSRATAGINKAMPDPQHGVIVRDPATGEPTGTLVERAAFTELSVLSAPSTCTRFERPRWPPKFRPEVGAGPIGRPLSRVTVEVVRAKLM